ncbi:hypothetical protein DI487_08785 [Flavobacterium sediminis]|uniref:Polysaccharide biosynthesis protein C-terminal domain-containing protein n=1 Tax=Flavobacterium sediminis TaxID=2201181 RepID=A0A2U8QUS7_9FLAO|nr:hypothetical protein [Flavobacterium sediminis]AWM13947.1 hypothetical protein DI487_08785 [Flavobacterium sediminis]
MNRFLKIGINIIRGITVPLLNFIIILSGIKHFGKNDWGEYVSTIVWISFFTFVANWGNKDYLIRKYSQNPSEIYSNFYMNLFSRGLLILPSFVLFAFFPSKIALLSIFIILISYAYNSFESLVIYQQKFGPQLVVEIIGFSFFYGALYKLSIFDLASVLEFYALSIILKLILISFLFNLRNKPFRLKIALNELILSFPFFILGLSGMISSKIDLYLVTVFLPNEIISSYQTITTAFLMLQALSVFITAPINKSFYRSNTKVISKLKILFKKIAIPISILGSLSIWLLLEHYIKLGFEWHIYLLCFLSSLPVFFYVIPILNLYKEKLEKKIVYSNLLIAILNCALGLILLKRIGLEGIFISVCVSQWLFLILIKKLENSISQS